MISHCIFLINSISVSLIWYIETYDSGLKITAIKFMHIFIYGHTKHCLIAVLLVKVSQLVAF